MSYHIYSDESGYPGEQVQSLACIAGEVIYLEQLEMCLENTLLQYNLSELKRSKVRSNRKYVTATQDVFQTLGFFMLHSNIRIAYRVRQKESIHMHDVYKLVLTKLAHTSPTYFFPDQNNALKRQEHFQNKELPANIRKINELCSQNSLLTQVCDVLAGAVRERELYPEIYKQHIPDLASLTRPQRYKYLCLQHLALILRDNLTI